MKKKVFVGLSGGVDSSVSALLLKEQGYDVTAVYMKNWSGESLGIDDSCPWEEDMDYVESVSKKLGIDYITYNFEKEYKQLVIEDFYKQYAIGNTPNPDILCNKFIKFDIFLNKALNEGADLIATGHYAITKDGRLFKGKDQNKDQTYFLSGLKKPQLNKTLFPIGNLPKKEVRKIARSYGLSSAERKDSQGICFVGKVDVQKFIKIRLKESKGNIVDIDTNDIVGKHNGVWFYTQGQRKGIGIGGGSNEPYFVCKKDIDNNILYVAKGKDNPALWSYEISVHNFSLIDPDLIDLKKHSDLSATIRYRGSLSNLSVEYRGINNNAILKFDKPQWAPAPGQSVVFYSGEECLGLAVID